MKKAILYLVIVSFIACATSSPVLYQPITDAKYPKTTKVDVFKKGEKPEQEYTEIGNLEVKMEARKEQQMYAAAVAKAKEVGADGIILIKDELKMELVDVPRDIDNRQGTDSMEKQFKILVFLAIKYVEE